MALVAGRPVATRREPARRSYDGDVKVSTRGDYASRALLSLALHEEDGGPTSVRDLAERTGLPQPYLEQILLALKGPAWCGPSGEWGAATSSPAARARSPSGRS